MNKMKYLLLLAICAIATGTMTSCLDSDDNSGDYTFTQEELNTYLTRLSGTYQGKLKYFRYCGRNKANTKDSLSLDSIMNIIWRVNRDSTITIANFPDSIYNNSIKGNADFRKILAKAPAQQTLKCLYSPYKGYNGGTIDYGFYTLPAGKAENNHIYIENKYPVDGKEYTIRYGYTMQSSYFGRLLSSGYADKKGNMEILYIMDDVKCLGESGFTMLPMRILLTGNKIY